MRLLPVTPEETAPEPEPESLVQPVVPSDPQANEAEVWVPLRSTWQPSASTWQPLAESWQQANGSTPAAAAPPMPNPLRDFTSPREIALPPSTPPVPAPVITPPAPIQPASTEPPLTLTPDDAPVETSLLLLPLVWFNQGFEACLAPLGAPGRWLCGPAGRQILGAVGVLCAVAAAVVAVGAGMGWTW
jgi:hypothetical protein